MAECDSELLAELVTPGARFPAIDGPLAELEAATDWAEAQSAGRVVPRPVRLLLLHPVVFEAHVARRMGWQQMLHGSFGILRGCNAAGARQCR